MKTKRLLLIGAAALLAAACASTPLEDKQDAPITDKSTSGATAQSDPLMDPNSPLAKRSVFFQYDSFVVQPEYQSVVEAHARYLSANRNKRVVIEGNTDERGGREYNLALGQKRADAVRRALATLGVDDAQMESVSFGEEKPRSTGTDEPSLAENRRADLSYR